MNLRPLPYHGSALPLSYPGIREALLIGSWPKNLPAPANKSNYLPKAVDNAGLFEVVGRHLQGDLIADEDADIAHAHLPTEVGDDDAAIFELHSKMHIGQKLFNEPLPKQ